MKRCGEVICFRIEKALGIIKLPTHRKNTFTLKFPLDLTEFTEQYGLPVLFNSYPFPRVLTHCVRAEL